ncbi:hypothetical protein P170DRAFT_396454 [Aspergillus steynii IBT 23096]|uniref:C2H2-type domain-containing protein n=1 Tax=Aspergillus steynii IBT 23096 TaxID=1392250 RepID=A0A2I2GLN5_9EURO|nr:uncharacterized protein P170DRAFT_396454 [Aspergillus steynii IBT 23096]PLB53779.1 hypothetical protein P170DRAFT_396454 [Aspergillus steynii IBT 23096]
MDQSPPDDNSEILPGSRRKPRTCPHCKRHFRRHEHLQRHVRIHTNEKPYTCACGASFARRDLLKRHHAATHSPITPSTQHPSPATGASSQIQTIQSDHLDTEDVPWVIPGSSGGHVDPVESQGQMQGYQPGGLSFLDDYDPLEEFVSFSHSMGLTDWTLPTELGLAPIIAKEPNYYSMPTPSSVSRRQERSSSVHVDHSLTQLPAEKDSIERVQTPGTTISLPSCHSLSRFANAFFDSFYPHVPIVHIPSFNLDNCDAKTILSMAALGAQCRHEHRKAVILFYAAKTILKKEMQEREERELSINLAPNPNTNCANTGQVSSPGELTCRGLMSETRCALYLIAFATWQSKPEILREAFNLQSFLARCVREGGLEESQETLRAAPLDWHTWVEQETHRRIKLFSFAWLNLQSIAFGVPPIILTDEVHLRLPCTCIEWISPNQERWSAIHKSGHQEQMLFQDALHHLERGVLDSNASSSQPVPSPLANYILLHPLIQRITLAHRTIGSAVDGGNALLIAQKEGMRNSLRAWTLQWQRAPESSLDPRNPNGPVTFTSTALLGLAYVRLAFDMSPYKVLESRNPSQIAARLFNLPDLPHGPHLLPAMLHATHALSIPVKLGVDFVARSHAFVWSIQHSICGFEFAVFLCKWLYHICDTSATRPLDEHESRSINWISDIVEEGRTSGDEDLCPEPVSPSNCKYLAYLVVKLWARLIRGNGMWAILGIIGESLDIYADICRDQHISS